MGFRKSRQGNLHEQEGGLSGVYAARAREGGGFFLAREREGSFTLNKTSGEEEKGGGHIKHVNKTNNPTHTNTHARTFKKTYIIRIIIICISHEIINQYFSKNKL